MTGVMMAGALTVAQLIERPRTLPPDLPVFAEIDYGAVRSVFIGHPWGQMKYPECVLLSGDREP